MPTLRNIAVTAPYMHDGSIATLDEVLDHYAAGAQDRADLLAFLAALTDDAFLTDPDLADPWR